MLISRRLAPDAAIGILLRAVVASLLLALLFAAGAHAQTVLDVKTAHDRLEGQRAVVDSVEGGLGRDGLRSPDLDELRGRLDPVRTDLTAAIELLEPVLADLNHRIQELGPKPAADAPPENASITTQRDELTAQAAEVEGLTKQVRLLNTRGDQLSDRITSRRRALFTDQLLARSYSILNPELWLASASAMAMEARGIRYLLSDWQAYAGSRVPLWGQLLLALGVVGIGVLATMLRRLLARPLRRLKREIGEEPLPRLKACIASMLTGVVAIVPAILAVFASIALLDGFDVLPARMLEVMQGVLLAVTVVSTGRGMLLAALAPDEPWRRAVPLGDQVATLLYRHIVTGIWLLGLAAFLGNLHRALVAPVALTVTTNALLALGLAAIAVSTVRALAADDEPVMEDAPAGGEKPGSDKPEGALAAASATALQWARFPFWVLNFVVLGALLAGYVGLASYLASRSLLAVVFALFVYVLLALINAFFIEGIAQGHKARMAARTLGVRPASLELIAVLVAGVLKVVVVMFAVVIVVGTWGTSTADLRDVVSRVTFGFTIGTSTVTIGDILYAVLFLVAGIVIARAIQRWFSVAILPRTAFDPGLQNSIATIIGYVISLAVIAMAMGQIGLNLQNIALVAGALSVGIGFGLQSIVSNFVSGLILLAERPIRVGDTISVKGEEGYVRRISVRATEIETFDRAAVLIPNSDLITGLVKNYTHANTTGRIILQINVAYDSDAEEVRDLLIGCACDHPQVLRSPPPRVFLVKFGDSYLQFELRCVVANVDYALTVKSDLHFAVLDRMKQARIGIPFTPWNIYRGGSLQAPDPTAGEDG
ncbi:DUF3772 domain-containing protein [Ancylobacter defluvii]|uniref:Mechanosensitive ion channel protein MscS n=1 Tax=Ancylobacter defluvii TaxID=1282440 RepID=A0A9W6JSC7_9HYPH|nr:DUF3772 domain-containing protein [Ancylobacter defluvii]GLK82387.1 mechanosensitive ion channel protein MscS [Ancylobacter defluvii]